MQNIRVIGHRGARGLVTENTLESFQKAIDLGVDAIEFDIWTTQDGVVMVHHDENLLRMTGKQRLIPELRYDDIRLIRTIDGKHIPTAGEVVKKFKDINLVIELKDRALTEGVIEFIKMNRVRKPVIISFNYQVLADLKKLFPDLVMYPLSKHPIKMINVARKYGFQGIGINSWSFNLFIYWLAKVYRLKIYIYPHKCSWFVPSNNFLYVKMLGSFRLNIEVETDFPDKIVPLFKK